MRHGCALVCVAVLGCGGATRGRGESPAVGVTQPSKPPPLTLAAGGETVRIAQRGRASLPGSSDALSVQLGDITGGAVELVLARTDGSAVLVTKRVAQGEVVPFTLDDVGYELVVDTLHNELVGDDWAVVRVRAAGATAEGPGEGGAVVDERARIEALIDAVARSGVVFIRNGTEHDSASAADHLRTKWSRAGDRIATADAFIEQLGSTSSQTGAPYRVRMPDGSERDAGPWLRELLAAQPSG